MTGDVPPYYRFVLWAVGLSNVMSFVLGMSIGSNL